jgi:hypothetical protein
MLESMTDDNSLLLRELPMLRQHRSQDNKSLFKRPGFVAKIR